LRGARCAMRDHAKVEVPETNVCVYK